MTWSDSCSRDWDAIKRLIYLLRNQTHQAWNVALLRRKHKSA
uniref:Uncharacterized protein n=1 Tax=Rhizophora mucronata TaxID=61149 RepID=A0A2P2NPS0_RHIMU